MIVVMRLLGFCGCVLRERAEDWEGEHLGAQRAPGVGEYRDGRGELPVCVLHRRAVAERRPDGPAESGTYFECVADVVVMRRVCTWKLSE